MWKRVKRVLKSPARRVVRSVAIPAVRGYLRYAGTSFGKKVLWDKVVGPRFRGLAPAKFDFVAKTIFGSKIASNVGDILGRYVYYFGVWEPNLTTWIGQRLAPGDVFVDVGANIGYHTLLASKLVGESGKVVSIEAFPPIFALLQKHLSLNRVRNVRAVNCAVWDKEDLVTFYTGSDDLPVTTTAMPRWAAEWGLEKKSQVAAKPLSDILDADEIKATRLIKIDVEGAEWRVLSGMTPLLACGRDDLEIILEVTPSILEAEGKTTQDILDFFATWGFLAYSMDNSETAYFAPPIGPPRRIGHIPQKQTDVIFSRIDAEALAG
jgi:FkbM family methyltransferase